MIKINDVYRIESDGKQYTLVKTVPVGESEQAKKLMKARGIQKKNDFADKDLGYYMSLSDALNGYIRIEMKQKVKDNIYTLKEIIQLINEFREEIRTLTREDG